MEGVCKLVIQTVVDRKMKAATKAALGVKHRVQEWAIPSLNLIARRPPPCITAEEGDLLGVEALQALMFARDSFYSNSGLPALNNKIDFSRDLKQSLSTDTWAS